MTSPAFPDPRAFAFVPRLERAADELRAERQRVGDAPFEPSPDSLTTRRGRYDEAGWLYVPLWGEGSSERLRAEFPLAAAASERVPALVNAGLSLFRPGTHLFPHAGELEGVLRCHLALEVPEGDVGLRVAGEVRRWREGRCLLFDDGIEHEAWNHTERDRVVLLVTFRPGATETEV